MSDRCKACGDVQNEVPANVLFHPFPVDVEKRVTWEEKCKEGGLFDPSPVKLEDGQSWGVCSRHFRRADYLTINNDIHILRPNATPSIFKRKGEVYLALQNQLILAPNLTPLPEGYVAVNTQDETIQNLISLPTTLNSQPNTNDIYKNCESVDVAHNWKNRCRVCGKLWANSVLINLFGEKGQGRKIAQKINSYLPINVRQADNLPLRVCKPCVEKINGFHDFYAQCKIADTEFHNEINRFKKAKALQAQEKVALENRLERKKLEALRVGQHGSGRRARKVDPSGKRSGAGQGGPKTKRNRTNSGESSGIDDVDDLEIIEETTELPGEETEQPPEEESFQLEDQPDNDDDDQPGEESSVQVETVDEMGDVVVKEEDESDESAIRSREGTQRFNLRSAPRRNVTLPFPLYFLATRPVTSTPSILRQKRKSPEPTPRNQIRLPPTIFPRRTRRRGPKDRRPRSKRYFMTRKKYGDEIVNQNCNSPDCTVVCETVELYLEHKYLYHDESNFSFCRICSQVYETKPRNEDNGHRHAVVDPEPLPALEAVSKGPLIHSCKECNKIFQDKSKLTQHNKIMHGSFHCSECGKQFTALVEFKKHLQDHIFTKGGMPHRAPKKKDSEKFSCEICKTKTTNFMQLNIHTLREHEHDFKYLLCDCCNNVFYTEQLLKLHKDQQQREDLQLCENCGGTFATIDELRMHKKACTTMLMQKPIACKPCNSFVHPNKMRAHLAWHLTKKEPARCKKCLLSKWTANKHNCKFYRCEACQLGFNGYPRYLAHKRTHVGKDAKYFCNVCSAGNFDGFEDLVEHFKSHSPDEVKDSRMRYMSTMPSFRICPVCLECVSKNVMQKHHKNKHEVMTAPDLTKEEILTCPVCNKEQPDVEKYIEHRLSHDTQLLLNCLHCPLAFDNENRRSIHVMRCHSIEKRATCHFCSKVFNSTQKIRVHIMRHLKYKPYVCKQTGCKASYYQVGDWRKHSMLHLGINPNVCKVCNKQFMKAESLVIHNRKWHAELEPQKEEAAEVVYQCCKCEYQDKTEAAVLQHLETDHCDEVVVACDNEIAELSAGESNW